MIVQNLLKVYASGKVRYTEAMFEKIKKKKRQHLVLLKRSSISNFSVVISNNLS